VDSNRKAWNRRQKELRNMLEVSNQHEAAIALFLSQHAMLHATGVSNSGLPSFEDEVFAETDPVTIRRFPKNAEHSLAWCIWHIARIEDVTMNLLVAGSPQIFIQGGWRELMGIEIVHTGNAMDAGAVVELSDMINIGALRDYRKLVGRRTREIVQSLAPEAVKSMVDPNRLIEVFRQGAVIEEARRIADYWGRRTIAGLLLMPPTRHCFVHLNEAMRLRSRRD
jgi:hypothetical protein